MLWGLLKEILGAFGRTLYKKAVNISSNLDKKINFLLSMIPGMLVVVGIFFMRENLVAELLDPKLLGLIFLSRLAILYYNPAWQKIMKKKKMSVLLPYTNLGKIFLIIIGFLFVSRIDPTNDVSLISFIIALLTVVVVILFSMDYDKFKIPDNIGKIFLIQFLWAVKSCLWGLALIESSVWAVFVSQTIMTTLMLSPLLLYKENRQALKRQTKDFYLNRLGGAGIGSIVMLLSFSLIDGFGLVISTLLGFLGIILQFIMGYFILDDKPTKKNIIMSIVIFILVFLGFYFK